MPFLSCKSPLILTRGKHIESKVLYHVKVSGNRTFPVMFGLTLIIRATDPTFRILVIHYSIIIINSSFNFYHLPKTVV